MTACELKQQPIPPAMQPLHPALAARVRIDRGLDYSRADEARGPGIEIPCLVLERHPVSHELVKLGEVYNAYQAEDWLVSHPEAEIVCQS